MPPKALEKAPDVALKDVEWRVDGKPTQDQRPRSRFVPYIDAARAASLLDEWVGPGNWSDSYEMGEVANKPVLWCHLSIRVGDEWVTKRDVGVASNFEAQKGMVSDAFKRAACLKWGVARNVYTLPTLWAPCRVDQKGNAWPSDQTLPAIHQELRKLGYEATGRIHSDESEVEAGSSPEEPAAGTPAQQTPDQPAPAAAAPSESATGGEVNGSGVTGTPEASTLPLGGEEEANEKARMLDLIESALDAGEITLTDVIRAASPVALMVGTKPPRKRADLKAQPLRVLDTVAKHLKLTKEVAAV